MVIGWIVGGIGLIGLVLAAWAWRGRPGTGLACKRCRHDRSADAADRCPECGSDRPPAARRRRRWITFGAGVLIVATGITGVSLRSVRETPLLAVMPTDVLIAGARVVPRSWLYEPVPRDQMFFGTVEGDALNQRKLSDSQKRRLTRTIDSMLAGQASLKSFGDLAAARPLWDQSGVPLSDEARLRLLSLLAERWKSAPAYDPSDDFEGFLGLLGIIGAGFGTLATEGFHEPDEGASTVVDSYIVAVAGIPLDDGDIGAAAYVPTWLQLAGPWFPAAVPTLVNWSAEQVEGRSAKRVRSNAAITTLTQTGAWNEYIHAIVIDLMRSEDESVASMACIVILPDADLAQAYEPVLRDVAIADPRDNVAGCAMNSLVAMKVFDSELYETAISRARGASEHSYLLYRALMRYPAEYVAPDVDFYLRLTAEADTELQSHLVGNLSYLHRTFEEADPNIATMIAEATIPYLTSSDENVRRSAWWVEDAR